MRRKAVSGRWRAAFRRLGVLAAAGVLVVASAGGALADDGKLKVGLVTFLSGGAAGPFGIPARNAAELVIDALNAGALPAHYNTKGIAGLTIDPIIMDEAGGAQKQVAEYRKLVQKQGVDVVIGYISSGDCKAIAPVVEELQTLTVFFDCGTPQVFEDIVTDPKYLFRTGAHATMDNVAAARYVLDQFPAVKKIAGINQNYAWGQDSWRDFVASTKQLKSGIEVVTEQFPKIYAGQYGAEISAILAAQPDVVHSSFWGGDMEGFVFQGAIRGVFQKSKVVLTCGETGMHRLAAQIPEGAILGARGPHGDYAPDTELNRWFRKNYFDRYGTWPTYPSYKMAQAILGVKTAFEKAAGGATGTKPSTEQVIKAFAGLEYESFSGKVRMALSKGHQAIQDTAYGQFKYDKENGRATLVNVRYYPAECVNPPEGMKSIEWIESGFPGAKCD